MDARLLSRRQLLAGSAAAAVSFSLPRRGNSAEVPGTGATSAAWQPLDDLLSTFLAEHQVPGAAIAVMHGDRLVYARGFGWADRDAQTPVAPDSLFRIASLSKPITAVTVLTLVEQGRVGLDDRLLDVVPIEPFVAAGQQLDPRVRQITIRQLLQHTAGWDREQSFDPIGRPRQIAMQMQQPLPPSPKDVMRFALGLPLEFDPGSRYAYANVDYLCLGRVIEHITGLPYAEAVQQRVLAPLNITRMQLGRALKEHRQPGEVCYYDSRSRRVPCLFPPHVDEEVPMCYGGENVEGFEAHGGWIGSAIDLARFTAAFSANTPGSLLKPNSIQAMWERPAGAAGHEPDGTPKPFYYGCGWSVRPVNAERLNAWHTGRISGTSALMVRRWDGLSWAILFNTDATPAADHPAPASLIDPLLHAAIDASRAAGAW